MKTTHTESLESNWHLQILNDCDIILNGLSRVIGNLRKQRRRDFRNLQQLSIFQDSRESLSGAFERSDIA